MSFQRVQENDLLDPWILAKFQACLELSEVCWPGLLDQPSTLMSRQIIVASLTGGVCADHYGGITDN